MILRACEKNNINLDGLTMSELVNNHKLEKIYMHGSIYTYSTKIEKDPQEED